MCCVKNILAMLWHLTVKKQGNLWMWSECMLSFYILALQLNDECSTWWSNIFIDYLFIPALMVWPVQSLRNYIFLFTQSALFAWFWYSVWFSWKMQLRLSSGTKQNAFHCSITSLGKSYTGTVYTSMMSVVLYFIEKSILHLFLCFLSL